MRSLLILPFLLISNVFAQDNIKGGCELEITKNQTGALVSYFNDDTDDILTAAFETSYFGFNFNQLGPGHFLRLDPLVKFDIEKVKIDPANNKHQILVFEHDYDSKLKYENNLKLKGSSSDNYEKLGTMGLKIAYSGKSGEMPGQTDQALRAMSQSLEYQNGKQVNGRPYIYYNYSFAHNESGLGVTHSNFAVFDESNIAEFEFNFPLIIKSKGKVKHTSELTARCRFEMINESQVNNTRSWIKDTSEVFSVGIEGLSGVFRK
ncbi:MAG: hypothetical protein HON90_10060 [Halobacteriovoraceae bacterium]|jgi:hypothetical protein|nr:hypothetical protein [Halobacteriovoraceae bacterium]